MAASSHRSIRKAVGASGGFGGCVWHVVGPVSVKRFDRQGGGANLNEETLPRSRTKEERHADQFGP
jgi:hypothetical protein